MRLGCMCLTCQNVVFVLSLEVYHFTSILVFTSVLLYGCYYICTMKLFETWEWLITRCQFILYSVLSA